MEQKKKHPHAGHRQRLKDKAREVGIEFWPTHEVLELILTYLIPQKDVNPLAHELLDTFGSLGGVLDIGYEQLIKVKGIGKESALFLSLLPDIFSKYSASKKLDSIFLSNPNQTVNYFRNNDFVKNKEVFYIFCLNANKKLLKTIKFNGDFESFISLELTQLAQKVLFNRNRGIVIMHSHPNGNRMPTKTDIKATKKLLDAVGVWGIKLEDHIIVTEDDFYSFFNNGLVEILAKNTEKDVTEMLENEEFNKYGE